MHKQSGPLIGQCDVAVAASQSLGLISMLCFETGVCEHINKCFFWEDSLCGGVWAGCRREGGDKILSTLLWAVGGKVVTQGQLEV